METYSQGPSQHIDLFLCWLNVTSLSAKSEVRRLKSEIPIQNGCQKIHQQNSKQSVIIKITQQNIKWSPKNSENSVQTLLLLGNSQFLSSLYL